MRSIVTSVSICFVLGFYTTVPALAEKDKEGIDVLQSLKDGDSILDSGITVASVRYSTDAIIRGRLFIDVTRKWRLTLEGNRCGYEMEAIAYEPPKYVPVEGLNQAEPLPLAIRTKQWGYWGDNLSGNHYEDIALSVSPAGETLITGKMHNSSLFGPRDEGPIVPRRVGLWSLGRDFSKYLDEVTSTEKMGDGQLNVTATGKRGDREFGRWELEIEPDVAWMVRKARFYRDTDPKRVRLEMRNEGTVGNGPYCIPKTAEINYWGPLGEGKDGTERLEFEPLVEEFDERLYKTAQKAVAHNQAPTLTVHDHRRSPPEVTEPFRRKKSEPSLRDE